MGRFLQGQGVGYDDFGGQWLKRRALKTLTYDLECRAPRSHTAIAETGCGSVEEHFGGVSPEGPEAEAAGMHPACERNASYAAEGPLAPRPSIEPRREVR